ncbi:hypothetical protein PF008_g13918 [Phytophthora fragariae]|uniref:Uncharacterized protein n=1 Tax=Phytophthora fragariae TaxID=53985 RepID=A0A6G0RIH9_9STRA|nr:hypothetical protein PF008_g13918 [Phytophthora fragariae]
MPRARASPAATFPTPSLFCGRVHALPVLTLCRQPLNLTDLPNYFKPIEVFVKFSQSEVCRPLSATSRYGGVDTGVTGGRYQPVSAASACQTSAMGPVDACEATAGRPSRRRTNCLDTHGASTARRTLKYRGAVAYASSLWVNSGRRALSSLSD